MTSLRALAMGALLGFLAALGPSCQGNCNANNCAGCCDSAGKCLAKPSNQTDATCGTAGAACVDCTKAGQKCTAKTTGSVQSYVCAAGAGGGSGNNCGGCLTADNFCAQGITNDACGSGGVACMTCTAAKPCSNGSCGGLVAIGAACAAPADCAGLPLTKEETDRGFTALCKQASLTVPQLSPGFTYPGGYCTKRCVQSSDCGATNACVVYIAGLGEYENQCMKLCGDAADCRSGYACYGFASGQGLCLPRTADGGLLPEVDAGPGFPTEAGGDCMGDSECMPPSIGFCARQALVDGGSANSCSADCGASPDSWCGNGGVCNLYQVSNDYLLEWMCDRGCGVGWDAGCRSGFVCKPASVASRPGICVVDCHGAGCSTGACQPSGLCQ